MRLCGSQNFGGFNFSHPLPALTVFPHTYYMASIACFTGMNHWHEAKAL